MKIEIMDWESDIVPEFPLDLLNRKYYDISYPIAMVWENGQFSNLIYNKQFSVVGVWNPVEYYSELYIKTIAEIYDTEKLLIGIDKEKNRFFAIIFLNPVELTNV